MQHRLPVLTMQGVTGNVLWGSSALPHMLGYRTLMFISHGWVTLDVTCDVVMSAAVRVTVDVRRKWGQIWTMDATFFSLVIAILCVMLLLIVCFFTGGWTHPLFVFTTPTVTSVQWSLNMVPAFKNFRELSPLCSMMREGFPGMGGDLASEGMRWLQPPMEEPLAS